MDQGTGGEEKATWSGGLAAESGVTQTPNHKCPGSLATQPFQALAHSAPAGKGEMKRKQAVVEDNTFNFAHSWVPLQPLPNMQPLGR